MKKSKLSHRITWRIIAVISFFNVLILAAIFVYVFRVSLKNSDMRGQYVVDDVEGRIESMLWAIHLGAVNSRDDIERNMESPEQVFDALERQIVVNHFMDCFAAFEPNYFEDQGRWFEAYLYYADSTGSADDPALHTGEADEGARVPIPIRRQIGSASHDYFNGVWYKKGLSRDRDGVGYLTSPYFDDSVDSAMYCSYVLPLFDRQGRKVGVFGLDLDFLWLSSVIDEVENMVKREFLNSDERLHDRYGNIYFSVQIVDDKGDRVFGSDSLDLDILKSRQNEVFGNLGMKDLEGTPYYVNSKAVPYTDWTVTVIQHRNLVFTWGGLTSLGILLCLCVGCIFIFFFTSRSIRRATRPLQFLSESAREVAKGRFDAPLPTFRHNDEVAQLSRSFAVMQQSLVEYIDELKDATARKVAIEHDLQIASAIQMGMLPDKFPTKTDRDDVQVFASLKPAKEVGGDLFDFYFRDEKLFFCIGDVSGKGLPASLFMAVTRSIFRTVSAHESMPDRIVITMNKTIADMNRALMFVTLFVGVLDLRTGHLHYCNAGHDVPLLIHPEATPRVGVGLLPCDNNIPVGFRPSWQFSLQEAHISPGTTIFLYTDGLTEAMDASNEQFRMERVLEAAHQALTDGQQEPRRLIGLMSEAVSRFVGDAQQSDDLTMMAIQYVGPLGPTGRLRSLSEQEHPSPNTHHPARPNGTLAEHGGARIPLTLVLPAQLQEVPRLNTFVEEASRAAGFDDIVIMKIKVAVEEAVVNVMKYAYQADEHGEVNVEIVPDDVHLNITITDSGKPFDPTAWPEADTTLSARERKIGGLGIHIMRQNMDTVGYERRGEFNVLTMKKKLEKPEKLAATANLQSSRF